MVESMDPRKPNAGVQDDGTITREQWKWTTLAGMASYIDAGSIVALGAALAPFQEYLNLGNSAVGALAAIGPNALGCAVGAVVAGRLADTLGRKRIYQYDLLVYAFGVLLIAFAVNPFMLFAGTLIVGLAVGADVPASLALVGELSPAKARGKLLGYTQIAWSTGPVVVLLLALVLSPLGLWGNRIVFLQLFVVAMVTWALRRGLTESERWKQASAAVADVATTARHSLGALFRGPNLRALVWTATIYVFWGLAAGTAGIFQPYFIRTLNAGGQAASVGLSAVGFIISAIAVWLIYMPKSDQSHRARWLMWGVGAVLQIVAYGLFLFTPFVIPIIVLNIVMFAVGAALAGEPTYKTFSQELFPTMLRGTAQGLTFAVARTILGIWSFFVPVLATTGIRPVAALLTAFLLISGVVGLLFMPNTAGKSLEQIEAERSGARV
jgi:MFS transporter, SP family, inositol transporter